jgi:glycosyltransferase involved in cell wall biosynthesis
VSKINIIVPVYNVEKYLSKCIHSILSQTFSDFELILVNDGSTDYSGNICDEFANQDSRIKVIHKENAGVSSARNTGLKLSTGDYICFVDSDDIIDETMIDKMYKSAITNDSDIVMCGIREENTFTNSQMEFISPLYKETFIEGKQIIDYFHMALQRDNFFGFASMVNKMYKKSHIINITVNDNISVGEDLCFNIHAVLNATRISAVNEPLYIYKKVNVDSITMNNNGKSFYLFLEARQEVFKILNFYKIESTKYVKNQNLITIGEYINQLKNILKSNQSMVTKFRKINILLNDKYLKQALKYFDSSKLQLKGKMVVALLRTTQLFRVN